MDTSSPVADPGETSPAFREWQAIRCLEAATAILASPFATATAQQINTRQTAARSAPNPNLRAQAQAALDAWAAIQEPAVHRMVTRADLEASPNVVFLDAALIPSRRAQPRKAWDPMDAGA